MEFRKQVKIQPSEFKISHSSQLLSIGSCFSENIGGKLTNAGFDILTNPFGIIFNPISIAQILSDAITEKVFDQSDIFENNSMNFSLNHHGLFKSEDSNDLLDDLNNQNQLLINSLKKSDLVLITLGTAWVYELIENNSIVANCHRLPNNLFSKRMLGIDEIIDSFKNIIPKLNKVIFTVSPVRHWKDGVVENSRSKSTLHLAIQEMENQFDNVQYFPSYEIVMDELRDYRFYKEDMLHPNQQTVDYIWEKFQEVYFTEETEKLVSKVESFRRLSNHKLIDDLKKDELKQNIQREFKSIKNEIPNFK